MNAKQAESLERILRLVDSSIQHGVEAGDDEERKIATGIILRDLGILQKMLLKRSQRPVLILPQRSGFDAS